MDRLFNGPLEYRASTASDRRRLRRNGGGAVGAPPQPSRPHTFGRGKRRARHAPAPTSRRSARRRSRTSSSTKLVDELLTGSANPRRRHRRGAAARRGRQGARARVPRTGSRRRSSAASRIPLGRGFAGRIAAERRPIVASTTSTRRHRQPDAAREGHYARCSACRSSSRGAVIGVAPRRHARASGRFTTRGHRAAPARGRQDRSRDRPRAPLRGGARGARGGGARRSSARAGSSRSPRPHSRTSRSTTCSRRCSSACAT